jgi:hypothetical protein
VGSSYGLLSCACRFSLLLQGNMMGGMGNMGMGMGNMGNMGMGNMVSWQASMSTQLFLLSFSACSHAGGYEHGSALPSLHGLLVVQFGDALHLTGRQARCCLCHLLYSALGLC